MLTIKCALFTNKKNKNRNPHFRTSLMARNKAQWQKKKLMEQTKQKQKVQTSEQHKRKTKAKRKEKQTKLQEIKKNKQAKQELNRGERKK